MSTCDRCGAGDWHPEVASCTRPDCGLTTARVDLRRQPAPRRGSAVVERVLEGVGVHGGING